MSTQNIQASPNNSTYTVNKKNYMALKLTSLTEGGGGGVRARHPPLAPAFGSWPPASHQQIAHAMGHPPEPGLTEPPTGFRVAS